MSDLGHREKTVMKGGELVENGEKRKATGADDVENGVLEQGVYGFVWDIGIDKILVTAEVTLRHTF